jgi:uroporphyrinogen-III synthase
MARRTRTVALTLAPDSLSGLADLLRGDGLAVREVPLLSFDPPADWSPVDAAILRLPRYSAVGVTSPRAAHALVARAAALKVSAPAGLTAWATGAATAASLRDLFASVEIPSSLATVDAGVGSILAGAMLAGRVGSPVLFPCGDNRRDELPAILRASGITVDEVVCYRSVLASGDRAREVTLDAHVLVVGSPRVAGLVAEVSRPDERPALVAIGPTTAAAARAAGWAPAGVANRPTVQAVAERVRAVLRVH